jgi:outer membrane lipoprotein-sorting protein
MAAQHFFNKILKSTFLLFLVLSFNNAYSKDSLSSLMQAMKSEQATRIAYKETKTLELMDQPWEGSGFMYSLPPDLMVKEQLLPKRVLMGIKGDKMFYFDQQNNFRHQGELDKNDLISLNVAVFKALINADEALLRNMYQVDFKSTAKGWAMNLTPKNNQELGFSTLVSGATDQQVDKISMKQADGDSSEFTLQKDASGERVKNIAIRLYQELQGE